MSINVKVNKCNIHAKPNECLFLILIIQMILTVELFLPVEILVSYKCPNVQMMAKNAIKCL